MKTSMRWVLFALLCLLQWSLPLAMVQKADKTLEQGHAYRFRTAPVDPADPFRGRYVTLDFEVARIAVPPQFDAPAGTRLYAPIVPGADGFATLAPPQPERPAQGDWLEVRLQWHDAQDALLKLPFDRYYLDEDLAPEAERLYQARNQRAAEDDPRRPAYAVVRVRNGHALIEELYIDDVPVRTLARESLQRR